ncbi:MAG: hypothetical protein ACLFTE_10515 [Salinivenus sp.]
MPNRDIFSFLPIGPKAHDISKLPSGLQDCARSLYRQARRDYRQAGCPYGETDNAMLVWYALSGDDAQPSPITGKN